MLKDRDCGFAFGAQRSAVFVAEAIDHGRTTAPANMARPACPAFFLLDGRECLAECLLLFRIDPGADVAELRLWPAYVEGARIDLPVGRDAEHALTSRAEKVATRARVDLEDLRGETEVHRLPAARKVTGIMVDQPFDVADVLVMLDSLQRERLVFS